MNNILNGSDRPAPPEVDNGIGYTIIGKELAKLVITQHNGDLSQWNASSINRFAYHLRKMCIYLTSVLASSGSISKYDHGTASIYACHTSKKFTRADVIWIIKNASRIQGAIFWPYNYISFITVPEPVFIEKFDEVHKRLRAIDGYHSGRWEELTGENYRRAAESARVYAS